jgi:electron-transferring-flavoprotein dehydrogenase
MFLTEKGSFSFPHFLLPNQLHNDGNYVISLSQLVRWLAQQAEELGVEIYPGFAADEVLYTEDGKSVLGVSFETLLVIYALNSNICIVGDN